MVLDYYHPLYLYEDIDQRRTALNRIMYMPTLELTATYKKGLMMFKEGLPY